MKSQTLIVQFYKNTYLLIMRIKFILFYIFTIVLLHCPFTLANEGYHIDKNTERTFNKPINIVIDEGYAPLTLLDVDGNPAGLFVDIWRLWSKKSDIEVTFTHGNWNDTLSYLKNRHASIHSGLFISELRARWISFSQPFYGVGSCFFYKTGSDAIDIRDTLKGMKIGAIKGSYQEEYLKNNYPAADVIAFSTREKMIRSVLTSQSDCLLSEAPSLGIIIDRLGLTGYFETSSQVFKRTFHAGVLKENDELLSLIDNVFDTISDKELAEIEKRWIPDSEKRYYREQIKNIRLTSVEKNWMINHPQIRVGFPSNFPPLFYAEDDVVKGISPDHLNLISTYSGLKFYFVCIPAKDLDNYIQTFKIDMSVAFDIPERKSTALKTLPSIHINLVVVGRNDMKLISGLSALKGKKIAIVRGIRLYNKILKDYPNVQVYHTNTFKEALQAVESKKADALMCGMVMVGHLLHQYPTLKIIGPAGIPPEPYLYVVNKKNPELVSIINKAIRKMPNEDIDAIVQKWFKVKIENKTNWTLILKWMSGISIFFVTIICLFLYWNNKLKVEISERKLAEKALKESEERHRSVLDTINDGVILQASSGEILTWNKGAEDIFKVSAQKAIGQKAQSYDWQTIHEDGTIFDGKDHPSMHTLQTGEPVRNEIMGVYQPSGDLRWIAINTNPLYQKDEKLPSAVAISFRDITEFRLAERKMAFEKERFFITLEKIPAFVYLQEQDYTIRYANKKFRDLFGDPENRLCHCVIHKKEAPCNPCPTFEVFNTKQTKEWEWKRNENETYLIIDNYLVDFDGTPLVLEMGIDITERKRAEKEKKLLYEQIQQAQKIEAIGTLAGGIAHDFNNMIGIIFGNVSYLINQFNDNKALIEVLFDIQEGAKKAQNLTQQLLTFAKGGAPIKKATDITSFIKESANFITRGAKVKCKFDLFDELWITEVDHGQLNQVISNLVINANQAMPNGGTITIRAKNTEITEANNSFLPAGKYIEIIVEDQGVGISQQNLQYIFDPYFSTKQSGSGLGLATSYSIIKKHGGHIWAESQIDKGSTFHIYLPSSDKKAIRAEKKEITNHSGHGKILIMDDEKQILKMVSRMLRKMGYEPHFAEDGNQVLEMFENAQKSNQPFDLVILDLTIPGGMGGQETMKELIKRDANVKAVVSSGYSNDPVMANYKEYGFCGVFPKPYSQAQMVEVFNRVLPK